MNNKVISGTVKLGLRVHAEASPTVFVSYTHRDRDNPLLVRMLADLRNKAEVKTWIAEERIHEGMLLMDSLRGKRGHNAKPCLPSAMGKDEG